MAGRTLSLEESLLLIQGVGGRAFPALLCFQQQRGWSPSDEGTGKSRPLLSARMAPAMGRPLHSPSLSPVSAYHSSGTSRLPIPSDSSLQS